MSVQVLLPGLSGKTPYLLNCHDGANVESFQLLPLLLSCLEYSTAALHRAIARAPYAVFSG